MRAIILTFAILAACAPTRETGPEAAWSLNETPGRLTLTAADADGPVLAMTCVQASRGFIMQAFRMQPIASNEEFSFGTTDDAVLLVADTGSTAPGVVARGTIPEFVLNSMLSSAAIVGLYGEQRLGPITAPLDLAGGFAGACIAPSTERIRAIGAASVEPAPQDGSPAIEAGRSGALRE